MALCGYSNRTFLIQAVAVNNEGYLALKQQILLAGFPEPSLIDSICNKVRVLTSDRSMISIFLNAIKQFSPDVSEIEHDIAITLGLNLAARSDMPTWHITGNFSDVNDQGENIPLIRQVKYQAAVPDSVIKDFSLFGYKSNSFIFRVRLATDNAAALRQALVESGLAVEENILVDPTVELKFNANSLDNFHRMLSILSQNSGHFAEISESFKAHINSVVTLPFVPMPQRARIPGFFNAPFRLDGEINLAAAHVPIQREHNRDLEMLLLGLAMRGHVREAGDILPLRNQAAPLLNAILAQTFNVQPPHTPVITMPVKAVNEQL